MGGRAKIWLPMEMSVVSPLTKLILGVNTGRIHETGPRVGRSTGIPSERPLEGTVAMTGRAHEESGAARTVERRTETGKVTPPVRRDMVQHTPNSEVLKGLALLERPRCGIQLRG